MTIDSFDGPYAFLSNFYDSPVEYEGEIYRTVEHAFQAAKTLDPIARGNIRVLIYPRDAKREGQKVSLRPGWDDMRIDVMLDLLRKKFAPGSYLSHWLIDTRDEELIEGNWWNDRFWGVCDGKGENRLGKLLMQVREELR